MRLRLNIKDENAVNNIIASLTDDQLDQIRCEVESLIALKRQNPLFSAIADYEPSTFTHQADHWLSLSDVDYQVMVSEMFFDLLIKRVTREYALNIWYLIESDQEP